MNKKLIIFSISFIFIIFFGLFYFFSINKYNLDLNLDNNLKAQEDDYKNPIVASARKQIGVVTAYDSGYYQGGYPPENSGACSDVIIRALLNNNYDLKNKINEDIKKYPERYNEKIDPNINHRRVKNIKIYFDNYENKLTTKINKENLNDWQPGDIVAYDKMIGGLWHIAIVSNRKNSNNIPLLIHNHGNGTTENDLLLKWPAKITGHYRINLNN